MGLLQFAPALALALPAGHLIDRHHRGRIVALCLALQTTIALLLFAGALGGFASRGLLLVISVALSAVRAFQMPAQQAQQALTPLLVPPALLARALDFSSTGLQGAAIAGPAIGGLIYTAGAGATYGSCAVLFSVACAVRRRWRRC